MRRDQVRTFAAQVGNTALESHALARKALRPAGRVVDEAYDRTHEAGMDERIALAGLRLAAVLNKALSGPPPA